MAVARIAYWTFKYFKAIALGSIPSKLGRENVFFIHSLAGAAGAKMVNQSKTRNFFIHWNMLCIPNRIRRID